MALVKATLTASILPIVTPVSFPTSTAIAATQFGSAYNTYALLGQSCSLLTPTLVMLAALTAQLQSAFDNALTGTSVADTAQAMADAFAAYWTGALFGATGTVVLIAGTAALKTALEAYFTTQAVPGMSSTPASVADALATHFDTFTKTVSVLDTAVPPPIGCGPAPIV